MGSKPAPALSLQGEQEGHGEGGQQRRPDRLQKVMRLVEIGNQPRLAGMPPKLFLRPRA